MATAGETNQAMTVNELQMEQLVLAGHLSRVEDQLECAKGRNARLEMENMVLKMDKDANIRKISEAEKELAKLKKENDRLVNEVQCLLEDLEKQVDQTKESQTYAGLLQKMIDNASDASSSSQQSADEEHQAVVNAMKADAERLAQENKELHEMSEEFGRMWSADSKQFRGMLAESKEEKARLQKEITDLKNLRSHDQKKISDLESAMLKTDNIQIDFELATKRHHELQLEMMDLKAAQKTREEQLIHLLEMQKKENAELLEKHCWTNRKSLELKAALDELYDSREKTAEQLQTLSNRWVVDRESYEAKISNMESEHQKASKNHKKAQIEWTNQMEALNSQIDDIGNTYSQFRHQLESSLQEANIERAFYQAEAESRNQEIVQNKEEFDKFLAEKKTVILHLEERINFLQVELNGKNALLGDNQEEIGNLLDTLSDMEYQIASLTDENLAVTEQKEDILKEAERLREQLRVTMRDYVDDKDKMEHLQEETTRNFDKQMRDVIQCHNNAMRETQSKMADMDNERKQYMMELDVSRNEMVKLSDAYKENRRKTHRLQSEYDTAKENFLSVMDDYKQLAQRLQNETVLRKKERAEFDRQMEDTKEMFVRQKELHDARIVSLKEAHKKLVDNMGVETLDDDDDKEEVAECAAKSDEEAGSSDEEDEEDDDDEDDEDEDDEDEDDEDEDDEDEDDEDEDEDDAEEENEEKTDESEPAEWEVVDEQ